MADRLAIVDVETTGLSRHDRIVEIAVVTIDTRSGAIINEFDSLVNPMRDVGPVHVHGVTASMVSPAPTFEDLAASVATHVNDSVLVAHNLTFDARMLAGEFARLGARFDPGQGICTLRLSGQRLNVACGDLGIPLGHHHRALADARATAELLVRLTDRLDGGSPAQIAGLTTPLNPRTLRREATVGGPAGGPLDRVVARARFPNTDQATVAYLDTLDWVLDDLVITATERQELITHASELGLNENEVRYAHQAYLHSLTVAALRDGVITTEERTVLDVVADLLGLDPPTPISGPPLQPPDDLTPGTTVCFTGTAIIDGQPTSRTDLESMATSLKMVPVPSVTKKTGLVVAADPASMSGKAKKARQYGIAVIGITDFVEHHRRLMS